MDWGHGGFVGRDDVVKGAEPPNLHIYTQSSVYIYHHGGQREKDTHHIEHPHSHERQEGIACHTIAHTSEGHPGLIDQVSNHLLSFASRARTSTSTTVEHARYQINLPLRALVALCRGTKLPVLLGIV